MTVSMVWYLAAVDYPRLNIAVQVFGLNGEGQNVTPILIDSFAMYGTDRVGGDPISGEIVRSEYYHIAYTSVRVTVQTEPFADHTPKPTFDSSGVISVILSTF